MLHFYLLSCLRRTQPKHSCAAWCENSGPTDNSWRNDRLGAQQRNDTVETGVSIRALFKLGRGRGVLFRRRAVRFIQPSLMRCAFVAVIAASVVVAYCAAGEDAAGPLSTSTGALDKLKVPEQASPAFDRSPLPRLVPIGRASARTNARGSRLGSAAERSWCGWSPIRSA